MHHRSMSEEGRGDEEAHESLAEEAEWLAVRYEELAGHAGKTTAYRGGKASAPDETVDVLLRLHERGRTSVAGRLERAFAEWLRRTGAPDQTLGAAAEAWQAARELGALPDELSLEVRRMLARGLRTRELALMKAALRDFGAVDRRSLADSERLRRLGGTLAAYASLLGDPNALSKAARSLEGARSAIAGIGALLLFAFGLVYRDLASRASGQSQPATEPPTAPPPTLDEDAMSAIARLRGSLGDGPLDQHARWLMQALSARDCGAARREVTAITSSSGDSKTQPLVDLVAAAVRPLCEGE
jgi:hypothetical protein